MLLFFLCSLPVERGGPVREPVLRGYAGVVLYSRVICCHVYFVCPFFTRHSSCIFCFCSCDTNMGLVSSVVMREEDDLRSSVRGGLGLENPQGSNWPSTTFSRRIPHGTEGDTSLHIAVREGKTEVVRMLLRNGADKDARNNVAVTPLCLAVEIGRVGAALALLAAGADVSLRCGEFERAVVHVAAASRRADILAEVVKHGADVNAADKQECTALHHACFVHRNTAVIGVLVEAGANIEARTAEHWIPLHCAAHNILLDASLALLNHGANVNARSIFGTTPLHLAALKAGTREPVAARAAANVDAYLVAALVDEDRKAAAVDLVLGWGGVEQVGAPALVDLLLRKQADENMIDIIGRTAAGTIGAGNVGDDVKRVCELLVNAPVDRTWRRRGYLVLDRARLNRLPGGATPDTPDGIVTELTEHVLIALSNAAMELVVSTCMSYLASAVVLASTAMLLLGCLRLLHEGGCFRDGGCLQEEDVPLLLFAVLLLLPAVHVLLEWSFAVGLMTMVLHGLLLWSLPVGVMMMLTAGPDVSEKIFSRVCHTSELVLRRAYPNSGLGMYIEYLSISVLSACMPWLALSTAALGLVLWTAYTFRRGWGDDAAASSLGWRQELAHAMVSGPSSSTRAYMECVSASVVSAFAGLNAALVVLLLVSLLWMHEEWYRYLDRSIGEDTRFCVGELFGARFDMPGLFAGVAFAIWLVMRLWLCVLIVVWRVVVSRPLAPVIVASTAVLLPGLALLLCRAAWCFLWVGRRAGDTTDPTEAEEESEEEMLSGAGKWYRTTVGLREEDMFRQIVGYL